MKKQLDLATWNRRDHFHFFRKFTEPFFGLVVEMDVTAGYETAKKQGCPFFIFYLHCSLAAANLVEAFRYRIENEGVIIHETIHASPTINRPDGTFDFSWMPFSTDLAAFQRVAESEIAAVRSRSGLSVNLSVGTDVIHFSAIPWLRFTSLSHARFLGTDDSVPKISFGKMVVEHGRRRMPVSIHVHHALVDGAQVGEFVERFQAGLDG